VSERGQEPRVGLIVNDYGSRHTLQHVLEIGGFSVVVSLGIENLTESIEANEEKVDAWLLDLTGTDIQVVLGLVVDWSTKPFLINDDIPPANDVESYDYWRRRLLGKLEVVALPYNSDIALAPSDGIKPVEWADKVWVLAASLGGPEAVSRFLKTLSKSLPISMVYAQHTETNFDQQLVETISRAKKYPVQLLRGEQTLTSGEVSVVPVDRQLRFLPFGKVVETRRSWTGIYQPVIDQVIAELARLYRDKLGVIIFSGMCNDGEIGVRVAKSCGSTVWVQSPESCVSPDMPLAAISTGCVSERGTPEELARLLSSKFAENFRTKR
jgi:chemosensory pili system protein ChpB (putative protein-glutamate methylesterase)